MTMRPRKMRVCFVQPIQSPYVTRRLRALAEQADLEVVLLVEHGDAAHRPGWRPERIDGVATEVLRSWTLPTRWRHADLPYETRSMRTLPWRLPWALARHRPGIVVACNATQLLFALPLRRALGYRIGISVEDTPHTARALSRLAARAKAWLYRRADFCLSFSDLAADYLRAIGYARAVHRTSWSLDLAWLEAGGGARERLRSEAGAQGKLVFLFTGALIARKGILPLLRAWAALPPEARSLATLWIAGSGPQESQARRAVQEHLLDEVRFLGQLAYAGMRDAMAAADVVVLPTYEDRFSLVVPEAMGCGRPVITTPYNGARELVDPGGTGWLVDVADERALVRALQRAIARRRQLPDMGRRARRKVAHMDNREVMARLAEVFRRHSPERAA